MAPQAGELGDHKHGDHRGRPGQDHGLHAPCRAHEVITLPSRSGGVAASWTLRAAKAFTCCQTAGLQMQEAAGRVQGILAYMQGGLRCMV